MSLDRRTLLRAGIGVTIGSAPILAGTARASVPRFKAIAFDAFPIFDPRPVAALAEVLFPGRGVALVETWQRRQFEYTWLRTIEGRYTDFMQVTADALAFAAQATKLVLPIAKRDLLLRAYLKLDAWPDAMPALRALKAAGIRLAFLSNLTPAMLAGCIGNAGLGGMFDHVLSTDAARTYKPDPRAYQLGLDAFALPREEILFVAFAGWDAAGAKSFGYPTFWVNRSALPPEALGYSPDASAPGLVGLTEYFGL